MFIKKVEELLPISKSKIAFGLIEPEQEILDSLEKASRYADITLVGPKAIGGIKNFDIKISKEPNKKIIDMLLADEVDGIIRGTIDDYSTYEYYKEKTGESSLCEAVLIQAINGQQFFLAPASNREGWGRQEKLELVLGIAKFIKEWNIDPKIAIITGIRSTTYKKQKNIKEGWEGLLNKTQEEADWLIEELKKQKFKAKNYEIESNTALKDNCNFIIPPNGMVGNQMFRMLLFSGAKIMSATRIGLSRLYEDNSRTEKDFEFHVKWLTAMINKRK
jgi:predicted methyltransferase MtxX (methanogen marker protein 4)